MEHLVKQDVFNGVARHTRVVEDAADHDGVVRGIVMAETAAGVVAAPGKLRPSHKPVKETLIQVLKKFFKVIMMAAGGVDVLASAHLPHQASLGAYIVVGDIAAIPSAMGAIDRLAIKLGEQDVSNRVQHGFGSALKQIG